MLKGTKKLFPTDYRSFTEGMTRAAGAGELPVSLQLNDIRDYTLKDFQDVCIDFNRDTGLELQGTFGYCRRCGKMHLFLHVDWPEKEEEDEIYVQ